MPEPKNEKGEEVADQLGLDTPHGFDISQSRATLSQKLVFIGMPVFIGMTFGLGFTCHWNYYFQTSQRNNLEQFSYFISCFKHLGTIVYVKPIMAIMGGVAPAFSLRNWNAGFNFCSFIWSLIWVNGPSQDFKRNHHSGIQDKDCHMDAPCLMFALLTPLCYTWSLWAVPKYSTRSAWGVYCCASFGKGITLRTTHLSFIMAWLDVYMGQFLITLSSGKIGYTQLAPVAVFAWKRIKYVVQLVISTEDTPWKMWCLFPNTYYSLLALNSQLANAMVGSVSITDVATFMSVDTLQFALRICLLARTGFRKCPKLFGFVLAKQLSNVTTPLPKTVAAMGHKTSMRIMQALQVLLEGETLTSNFLWLTLYFIQWGAILQTEHTWYVVPLKSFGVVAAFFCADLLQDIIASKVVDKFSNWSYLYHKDGWIHRRHLIQSWIIYYTWTTHQIVMSGGVNMSALAALHKYPFVTPVYALYHPSTAAWMHI